MILAAGEGRRLLPLTRTLPKALVPVAGQPMVKRLIDRLVNMGFDHFVVNLHHHADQLQQYLLENTPDHIMLTFSDEREMLLDTGGAIKHARQNFSPGEPFLVHNVDVYTTLLPATLLNCHEQSKAMATLAVQHRQSSRHLLFNEQMQLCGWRNNATGEERMVNPGAKGLTPLAFSGVHIADPKIFSYFPQQDRFSLIDLFLAAAADGAIVKALPHNNDPWFDLGTPEKITAFEQNEQWKR